MRSSRTVISPEAATKMAGKRHLLRSAVIAHLVRRSDRASEPVYLDDPCYQYLPISEPGVVFAADED